MLGVQFNWQRPCLACGAASCSALCPTCRPGNPHRVPHHAPGIQSCWTLSLYEHRLGQTVRLAKQPGQRPLAVAISELFANRMAHVFQEGHFQALLAAPSPWTRRLHRGFHLPSLQARALSAAIAVPVVDALRVSPGLRQAALERSQRHTNLKRRLRSTHPVPGRVLLIDDVWTTGATAQACAKELLGDQTHEVHVATLCVTRPPGVHKI
jgi:competence protein ComFC